jgi:hypothetical protein
VNIIRLVRSSSTQGKMQDNIGEGRFNKLNDAAIVQYISITIMMGSRVRGRCRRFGGLTVSDYRGYRGGRQVALEEMSSSVRLRHRRLSRRPERRLLPPPPSASSKRY